MTLTFTDSLDRGALLRAGQAVGALVVSEVVAATWTDESALPGLSIGGLVRHLVSQVECAVEFLAGPSPAGAETLTLWEYFDRVDWLDAPVESVENTSIRDDFNAMAQGGAADSVAILHRSCRAPPRALSQSGPETYVPWQDCVLALDDFLVCRLLEIVVHTDDLAASTGLSAPAFDDDVVQPVLSLLVALSARRHGMASTLRALARTERATGPVSAFGPALG